VSCYITATVKKVQDLDEHSDFQVFAASDAASAATMHRQAHPDAEEVVVFDMELGRRFRHSVMVEVPKLPMIRTPYDVRLKGILYR